MGYELLKFCTNHKSLLIYTILNYIDKFVIFTLPLIILYITKDVQVYNNIEYIFSVANITIVILEIGRIYLFYGYKIAENREIFLQKAKNYFLFLQLIYSIAGLILWPFISQLESPLGILYYYIVIRCLYMLFINFYNSYFRLVETPSRIFLYSIPINIITIILIYLFFRLKWGITLEMFFLPQCMVSLGSVLLFLFRFKWKWTLGLISYIRDGILFAWPIILNALIVSFVNNYGKIYAYNFLSESEMYSFSYVLRIAMIIQMAHASVLAYYSKEIYISVKKGFDKSILQLYSLFIGIAVILSVIFILTFNRFLSTEQIRIDVTFFLILLYVLLWCFQAFFEIYYNKTNNNKFILLYSLIGGGVYLLLILGLGVKGIKSLSIYMLISVLVNFVLILRTFFRRIKNYA